MQEQIQEIVELIVLCTLLGLSERRYNGDIMNVEKDINYNAVEEKLEKLRADSIKYLETALK